MLLDQPLEQASRLEAVLSMLLNDVEVVKWLFTARTLLLVTLGSTSAFAEYIA